VKSNVEKFTYFDCCVSYNDIDELNHIIDNNIAISYRTFRKYVETESFNKLKKALGYNNELQKNCNITLQNDWSISFHKSKTASGDTVYYLCHSCIEYIFKRIPT